MPGNQPKEGTDGYGWVASLVYCTTLKLKKCNEYRGGRKRKLFVKQKRPVAYKNPKKNSIVSYRVQEVSLVGWVSS